MQTFSYIFSMMQEILLGEFLGVVVVVANNDSSPKTTNGRRKVKVLETGALSSVCGWFGLL